MERVGEIMESENGHEGYRRPTGTGPGREGLLYHAGRIIIVKDGRYER